MGVTNIMLVSVAERTREIGVKPVSRLPLPTLFAGLPVSPKTALIAFGKLVLVGILSAVYPARRASLLVPVEALRCE